MKKIIADTENLRISDLLKVGLMVSNNYMCRGLYEADDRGEDKTEEKADVSPLLSVL